MTPQEQIKKFRQRADALRGDIQAFIAGHTGKGKYNPENMEAIDGLHRAHNFAANCRSELLVATGEWVDAKR